MILPCIARKEVLPGRWQWVVTNGTWREYGNVFWRLAWEWCHKRNFLEHCDEVYGNSPGLWTEMFK